MSPQGLKTSEAATYLGLSASTLAKMRVAGTGPRFCRVGGTGRAVRYRAADLDDYLASRAVQSTSAPLPGASQ